MKYLNPNPSIPTIAKNHASVDEMRNHSYTVRKTQMSLCGLPGPTLPSMSMKLPRNRWFTSFIVASMVLSSQARAQSNDNPSQRIIIFHAGSLTVPFDRIITGFKQEHPGVIIVREIAGSRECARKISELHQPCDVFASADYAVIDNILTPEYADWDLKFATNEMSIVYTDKSRHAKDINARNWYEILLDPEVTFGRSDPNADPCGYRTILTVELAERYYGKQGLAEHLLKKNMEYIRPKEVDLLALLEVGELDYIFIYRSVAVQHRLRYVTLPDQINLKDPEREEYYRQVSVELNGKKPGEKIIQRGESMVYGVTIPKNSPNPKSAISFVRYLMDKDKGMRVMEDMGQPSVVPSVCSTYDKLPAELKPFAEKPRNPAH
jgi:molybdate/tungstate transport system substrate-binding protein